MLLGFTLGQIVLLLLFGGIGLLVLSAVVIWAFSPPSDLEKQKCPGCDHLIWRVADFCPICGKARPFRQS